MTYDHRSYWRDRPLQQGPNYVGPAGNPAATARQYYEFRLVIEPMLAGRKAKRLLDFGCGSGRFSKLLSAYGGYTGVDLSITGIAQAIAANPELRFHWMEQDRIPIADKQVDLVVAITVFQHIVDAEQWEHWTGEIRRVLQPKAAILVIDGLPQPNNFEHMKPREPESVGQALGMTGGEPVLLPEHWACLYER